MNIEIIAVGRLKKGPELELIETYLKRCPWQVKITEVEEKRPIRGAERMAREADLILAAIPTGATVIAWTSAERKCAAPNLPGKSAPGRIKAYQR